MMSRIWIAVALAAGVFSGGAHAATVSAGEIAQIENALGVTLSSNDIAQLSAIVFPTNMPQWRVDAYDRIETHRKADLDFQVVDMNGDPVEGAEVRVRMKKNAFKFGGVCTVMDLTDADNNLGREGSTTDDWERITTNLFNAVGLNNGFKPKIANQHQYIPNFMNWASDKNLDVRGHLLIWPGGGDLDGGGDLSGTPGTDYGNHLSTASTSAYASYNVLGAVENWANASPPQKAARLADLKAEVDAEIAEWASQWDVYEWDVMNEVVGNTLLQQILGFDQMAEWFRIAETNKVSADTGLYINEFKIISADFNDGDSQYSSRSTTYKDRIDTVIADGAPITGIGFQSRFKYGEIPMETVYGRLDEFATLYPDVTMAGTEFELKDGQEVGGTNYVYDEFVRARMTEELLTTYFSHDQVIGLNVWDFMSASDDTPDEVSAAMAWYDGTIKLNGLVWYYLHHIRYNTDTTLASSLAGRTGLRVFKGDYDVTIRYNGQVYDATLALTNDDSVVYMLSGVTATDPGTAEVVDAWHYDGLTNGTGLAEAASTGLVASVSFNNNALASIVNGAVRWQSDGISDSMYQGKDISPYDGASNGLFQLSADFLDADFTATAALTNGSGRVQYGFRSDPGGANDDAYFRLVFASGGGSNAQFRLEVTDATGNNQNVGTFSGTTLEHLAVRAVYDLDNSGSAGSFKVYYRKDGAAEVLAHAGQLALDFRLDQLRNVVQTYNGGVNWAAGDRVFTDNLVVRTLGEPPPPPSEIVIDGWYFDGLTNGAGLSEALSVGIVGGASFGDDTIVSISNNATRWEWDGSDPSAFKTTAPSSYEAATSGLFQVSWDYVSADFANTDATDGSANIGFGIRSQANGNEDASFRLRYDGVANEFLLQYTDATENNLTLATFAGNQLSNLNVRMVLDLDSRGTVGSLKLYYTKSGMSETLAIATGTLPATFQIDLLRYAVQTTNGGTAWALGDVVATDNLIFSLLTPANTPRSLYEAWLANYPTIGSTNIADNLLFYAFGANPTNPVATGNWPVSAMVEQGGTNFIEYVHYERSDAESRGLDYAVQNVDDLVGGTWTNTGVVFVGEGIFDAEFDVVTNRLPAVDAAGFIRVNVEYAP